MTAQRIRWRPDAYRESVPGGLSESGAVPSRRSEIGMSPEQLMAFLDAQRVLVLASTGRDGRPHLTALWYVLRDEQPWIFTYARSQKVRNLERDARATLLVESGEEYGELRGATLYADATVHRDPDVVAGVGEELFERYAGIRAGERPGLDGPTRQAVRERAAKRVAVQFRPTRVVSWDHSKLGGTY
jgi:PPOX class probable F420-dependent enzyme